MGINNEVFNIMKSVDDFEINTRQYGDLHNQFMESGGFATTDFRDWEKSFGGEENLFGTQYVNKTITFNLEDGESITVNVNDRVPIDIKTGQISHKGGGNIFVGKHSDGTTKILDIRDLDLDAWQFRMEGEDTISEHPLLSAGDKTIDIKLSGRGLGGTTRYSGNVKHINPATKRQKGFINIKDVNEFEGFDTKLNDFGFYNNY